MAVSDTGAPRSMWAPLRVRAFRILWTTQWFAMVGIWLQTVGAQWQVVDEPGAAALVGFVQAAAMLPTLLLSLPAGALADIVDRRRMLVAVQLLQVLAAGGLTALSLTGGLSVPLLLVATFVLGAGNTATIPAYQSLAQDLVGRELLQGVSTLSAVSMNLARAVGPAVAGVVIAQAGVPAVFALTTLTCVVFLAVLLAMRAPARERPPLPESFGGALRAGTRYVRHSPVVRRLLVRTLLFVVPGSALWVLLPLVAEDRLGLDASGYGVLLGAMGVGSVLGVVVLPRVLAVLPTTRLVLAAGVVFGVSGTVTAVVSWFPLVVVALVPAGVAWLLMLSTMSSTLQAFLPGWVRGRGLAVYQMVFVGGQAIGSLLWGLVADRVGIVPVLLGAAGLLVAGSLTVLRWPLHDVAGMDRSSATAYWPDPQVAAEADVPDGPVLVTVTYTVPPANVPRFVDAMVAVRRMKLRTGATSLVTYRDGAEPDRFVEVAEYPSWAEHLRQHGGRLTGSDRALEDEARACADRPPEVRHLLPAGRTDP